MLLIESDLATLNQDFAVMEQQRGRAAQHFFTKLLSDKLLLRRANGKVMGKAEFLQSLQMLSPFTQYTIEQLEIAQVPDTQKRVMVTLVMQTEDRYTIVRRFRHIRFFTQHPTDGDWNFGMCMKTFARKKRYGTTSSSELVSLKAGERDENIHTTFR